MKIFNYVSGVPQLNPLKVEESEKARHYYSPNGVRLASVTTVLSYSKRGVILEWQNRIGLEEATKIKNRASVRGTKFHNMMEKYLTNDSTIFEGIMPDMKQMFRDARPVLDKIDNIYYQECPLYSETLGIAGRTDVIAEFDGVLSIIDFKTSAKLKKEEWIDNYFEQATAYSLMLEELTGIEAHQIVVPIFVDQEDKPQLFIEDRNKFIDSLMSKIDIYYKDHSHVC